MTEAEALALVETCSNQGRWGDDDERGTLNYVGPEQRRAAAALVRSGETLALGQPIDPARTPPQAAQRFMLEPGAPGTLNDLLTFTTHHPALTHMDAIAHVSYAGRLYNGIAVADAREGNSLARLDISPLATGVVARGILLDVAGSEGAEYLPSPSGIGADRLAAAAEFGSLQMQQGDVVFVRAGVEPRLAAEGAARDSRAVGLTVDAVPWLHENRVAVFSGDCIEQLPSPFERLPMPLHEIGLPSMGLVIVDNAAVEQLAVRCRELQRYEFMLVMCPLPFRGATGSPLNPLAVF